MKLIIIILLFPFLSFSQRLDIKTENGIRYKITNDTSELGIITIEKKPLQELGSEFRSYINAIDAEILSIDQQIESLKDNKSKLIAKKKDYKDILNREGL